MAKVRPIPSSGPAPLAGDRFLRDVPVVGGWKVLDPAVLYAKIGQGGMGAVYRGRHVELEIDVAVRCLKPSLVAEDEQFEARFRREARLAAELMPDNLVRLYDLRRSRREHARSALATNAGFEGKAFRPSPRAADRRAGPF